MKNKNIIIAAIYCPTGVTQKEEKNKMPMVAHESEGLLQT